MSEFEESPEILAAIGEVEGSPVTIDGETQTVIDDKEPPKKDESMAALMMIASGIAARMTGDDRYQLMPDECEQLSDAIDDVCEKYDVSINLGVEFNLAMVVAGIALPRINLPAPEKEPEQSEGGEDGEAEE